MEIFYLLVSLLASIVGAVCGIGGGVIIKPVLDMLGLADVATISFLSGCTVLAMSLYSVGKNLHAKESLVNFAHSTPLALGAAAGGVLGKMIFAWAVQWTGSQAFVGRAQAACLAAMTGAVFLYTLCKDKIRPRETQSHFTRALIGFLLGVVSSFLGIGGGPVNLVVFYYFFGMDTKTAAQNSLYVILISQTTSLATTILTRSIPDFNPLALVLMVSGGILGGILGHKINKRVSHHTVEKLFLGLLLVIIGISLFNMVK